MIIAHSSADKIYLAASVSQINALLIKFSAHFSSLFTFNKSFLAIAIQIL
ncbi:Uncharacterised protein [Chlamydia trachomatis]|nr:Uncharacterised protein [Chlamydia trachomatis]CRH47134.1 Uncharacterised protein [Chlamydia trachomatis]CRH55301.1 Uncharacterised protein [Chlamydia trachomatis]